MKKRYAVQIAAGVVYEKYQEYCTKNAIALSRSIELYMEKN